MGPPKPNPSGSAAPSGSEPETHATYRVLPNAERRPSRLFHILQGILQPKSSGREMSHLQLSAQFNELLLNAEALDGRQIAQLINASVAVPERHHNIMALCGFIKYQPVDHIEALWLAVEDMVKPEGPSEPRHLALKFMADLICGQYNRLGVLRTVFYDALARCRKWDDFPYVIRGLWQLTKDGRDLYACDRDLIPLLLWWVDFAYQQIKSNKGESSSTDNASRTLNKVFATPKPTEIVREVSGARGSGSTGGMSPRKSTGPQVSPGQSASSFFTATLSSLFSGTSVGEGTGKVKKAPSVQPSSTPSAPSSGTSELSSNPPELDQFLRIDIPPHDLLTVVLRYIRDIISIHFAQLQEIHLVQLIDYFYQNFCYECSADLLIELVYIIESIILYGQVPKPSLPTFFRLLCLLVNVRHPEVHEKLSKDILTQFVRTHYHRLAIKELIQVLDDPGSRTNVRLCHGALYLLGRWVWNSPEPDRAEPFYTMLLHLTANLLRTKANEPPLSPLLVYDIMGHLDCFTTYCVDNIFGGTEKQRASDFVFRITSLEWEAALAALQVYADEWAIPQSTLYVQTSTLALPATCQKLSPVIPGRGNEEELSGGRPGTARSPNPSETTKLSRPTTTAPPHGPSQGIRKSKMNNNASTPSSRVPSSGPDGSNGNGGGGPSNQSETQWSPTLPTSLQPGDLVLLTQERFYRVVLFMIELANRLPQYFPCRSLIQFLDHYCRNAFVPDEMLLRILEFYDRKGELLPLKPQWLTHLRALVIGSVWVLGSQTSEETTPASGAKRRRPYTACPVMPKFSVIQDSSDIGSLLEQVTPCSRPDLVRHRMVGLLADACNRCKDLCLNELCPILIPYLKLWIPLECNPAILVRLIHLLLDVALSVEGEAPYFRQLVRILLTMAYFPQTGSTFGGKLPAALGAELIIPEESNRSRHGCPRVRTTGIGRRGDTGMRRTSLQGQRYLVGHGGPADAYNLPGKHHHQQHYNHHHVVGTSSSSGSSVVGSGSHPSSTPTASTAGTGISHRSRRSMKNVMRTTLGGGRLDTLSKLLADNSEHAQFLTGQGLLPLQLVAYPFALTDLRVLPPVAIRAYAAAYGLARLLRHYLVSIRAAYPARVSRYLFRKALVLVNERNQVRLETRFTLLQALLALRANDEYRVYFHFSCASGKDVAFPSLTCRIDRHDEDPLDWDIYGAPDDITRGDKSRVPDGAPGTVADESIKSHNHDGKSGGGSLTRRLSSRQTLGLKKLAGSTVSLSGETLGKSSNHNRSPLDHTTTVMSHPRSSAQDGSLMTTSTPTGNDEYQSPGLLASSLVPSPFLFSYLPPTTYGSTGSRELSPGLPVPLKREALGLKRYLNTLIRLLRQETSWAILRLVLVYLPDQLNCTALFHGQVHGIRHLVDKLVRLVQNYPMPVECVEQDVQVQVMSARMLHEQNTIWARRMANAREYKRTPLDAAFDASRSLLTTMYQTQVGTLTGRRSPSSTKDKVTSWRHSGEALDRAVEQANLAVYYYAYAILPHLLYSYRGVLDKRHFTSLTACFIKGLHHLLDDRVIMVCMHALQLSCYEIPQEMTRELPRILTALNQVITMGTLDVYILEFLSALARLPKLRVNLVPENYKCIFSIALKYIKSSNEANTGWKLSDEDGDEDAPKTTVSRGAIHALSQYVLTLAYQVIDVWFMATKLADRKQYVEMIVRGLILANRNPTELDEATEMCIDMLLRYTYSNVSLKPTQSKEIVQLLLMGPHFLMQRAQQLEVDLYQELQGIDIQQLINNDANPPDKTTSTVEPPSRSLFKTILVRTPESSYVEERTWVQGHGIVTVGTSKFTPWSNVTIRRPSGVVSLLAHLNNELKVFLEAVGDTSVGLADGGVPLPSRRLEAPGSSDVDVASLLLTHWKMNPDQVDHYLQSLTSYCQSRRVDATVPTSLAPPVESSGPLTTGDPSGLNTTPVSPPTLTVPNKKFPTMDPSPRRSRVKGRSLSISKVPMDWLRSSSANVGELVSSSYTPSFQPPGSLAPVPEIDTGDVTHPSTGLLHMGYPSGEGAALLHRSKSDPQPPQVRRRRSTISEVLRHHATGQTAQGGSPDRPDRELGTSPSPLADLNHMVKSESYLSGYVRDVLSRFSTPLPGLTSPGATHASITQLLKGASAVDTTSSFMTPQETLFNPFFLYGQFSSYPDIAHIEPLRPVPDDESFKRHLRILDHVAVIDFHKIGIIYVGPGKTQEVEILQTTQCPSGFWRFLSNIGTLFSLRDCKDIYIGGLDKDFGTDGEYSVYWKEDITQVAFHVTPLMPTNFQQDPQCNLKKRHVGNDYVRIIYNESGQAYRFDTIRCEFNFVNIVIEPLTHNKPRGQVGSIPSAGGDGDEHLSQPLSTTGITPTESKYNSVDLLTSTSDTSTSGEDDNGWSPYDAVRGTIGMDGSLASVPQYRVYLQRHPDMPQFSPITEPKVMSEDAIAPFVRQVAMHANIFTQVFLQSGVKNGTEYVSNWRERLRQIKTIKGRVLAAHAQRQAAKDGGSGEPATLSLSGQSTPIAEATRSPGSSQDNIAGSTVNFFSRTLSVSLSGPNTPSKPTNVNLQPSSATPQTASEQTTGSGDHSAHLSTATSPNPAARGNTAGSARIQPSSVRQADRRLDFTKYFQ
ncbi:Tuberous sclerosis 2-like protein [Dispira simplex]|nr:Tuberous sclerosis 2-like protein [Dispira simplex]